MNTQWERRVAELEQALIDARAKISETRAESERFRLALAEAQNQFEQLRRMHTCDAGSSTRDSSKSPPDQGETQRGSAGRRKEKDHA